MVNSLAMAQAQNYFESRRSLPANAAMGQQYPMRAAEYNAPKNPFNLL